MCLIVVLLIVVINSIHFLSMIEDDLAATRTYKLFVEYAGTITSIGERSVLGSMKCYWAIEMNN
jgi:hypothetical protein